MVYARNSKRTPPNFNRLNGRIFAKSSHDRALQVAKRDNFRNPVYWEACLCAPVYSPGKAGRISAP
jgi:hypothetical protein